MTTVWTGVAHGVLLLALGAVLFALGELAFLSWTVYREDLRAWRRRRKEQA